MNPHRARRAAIAVEDDQPGVGVVLHMPADGANVLVDADGDGDEGDLVSETLVGRVDPRGELLAQWAPGSPKLEQHGGAEDYRASVPPTVSFAGYRA